MTLFTGKGLEAAAGAALFTLSSALPAKIAALNATESATILAMLAGPYVFASDNTLLLSNPETAGAVTITIPAGTYTATQLAAQLNGDVAFTGMGLEAGTFGDDDFFYARIAAKGVNGSIKVGAGTACSTLGVTAGQLYRYFALQEPELYRIADIEAEPVKYPEAVAMADTADISGDERIYNVTVRFHFADPITGAGATTGLLWISSRYAQLAVEVFQESANMHGIGVGADVTSIEYTTYELNNRMRGAVDIHLDVNLEEEN